MTSAHWHLTFDGAQLAEPVLWELAHEHGLVTNIRRANVEEDLGWVLVEVRGEPAALAEGRAWLAAKGVRVAEID